MNSNRAFLQRRNALWQQLRDLEPEDPSSEALLIELEDLIGWPRARILKGLGWQDAAPLSPLSSESNFAQNAIFDLAVNRAAQYWLTTRGDLAAWHAKTRFAARVPLKQILVALEARPVGDWHWSGGLNGAWTPGTAQTP
jgi:hypothetical protein